MKTKIELQYLRDGTGLAKELIDFLPTIGTVIENDSLKYPSGEKLEEKYFVVVSTKCKKINNTFICEVSANATTKEKYQKWIEEIKINEII